MRIVLSILDELGLAEKDMVFIFNKADKLPEITPRLQESLDKYQPHVLVSASSKEGLKPLQEFIEWWLAQ